MTFLNLRAPLGLRFAVGMMTSLTGAPWAEAWAIEGDFIRGLVLDARTGQAIGKARVVAGDLETTTDHRGRFALDAPSGEPVELSVAAVGYGVIRKTVSRGPTELILHLAQDAMAYAENLDVVPEVFDRSRDAPLAYSMQNTELRNLSSVVTDDVMRSVQTLPGVSAGDDFFGAFALRGSGFQNTGFYIDGVLVNSPFHTIRDLDDSFSLSILNNDVIDGVTLLSGAPPAWYGDRVGGALSIETRDGSRERTTARANLGIIGVSVFAEGPIGGTGTSWLLGARKSFLDYLLKSVDDSSFILGYYDVQSKLSRRSGPHAWSLFVLHGDSSYENGDEDPPRNDIVLGSATTALASTRWAWSPSPRGSLTLSAFMSREAGANRNSRSETLFDSASRQLGGRMDFTRTMGPSHLLQGGFSARQVRTRLFDAVYPRTGPASKQTAFDRAQWLPGGYLQDGWKSDSGKVALTAGLRVDRSGALARSVAHPRANGSLRLSEHSTLSFAAGAYSQFPNLDQLFGPEGNPRLVAEESDQYTLGLERRLSTTTRAQAQIYHQREDHRLRSPGPEIRFLQGQLVFNPDGVLQNAWSGTSRGIEVSVQRRSPNGISGWVSYTLAHARLRDAETGLSFDSDFDQRHTVNAYASYRLNHRTNLSAKFRYTSNTPLVGYFEEGAAGVRVSDQRNRLRTPTYSRLDLRVNRTFSIKRARLSLLGEVLNVLNHTNYRYAGRSVLLPSALVRFDADTLFPLLPAVGLTVEW